MPNAAQCAIILVNYKNPHDTLACLRSLAELNTPAAHIWLVDNGSPDNSADSILHGWKQLCAERGQAAPVELDVAAWPGEACSPTAWLNTPEGTGSHTPIPPAHPVPQHALLRLPANRGFFAGNNAALGRLLRYSDCQAFWLLNNDAQAAPDALDALCSALSRQPAAGLCGSTVFYASTPDILQGAGGGTISYVTGATVLLLTNNKRDALARHDEAHISARLDWIFGCSMLIRRTVFERIGLLPEEYFLYHEDVAFSLAARKAGFSLAWAKNSLITHKEGGTSQAKGGGNGMPVQRSTFVDYLHIRNRFYLLKIVCPAGIFTALASLAGVFFNRIRRGQARRIPLLAMAALHGLTGKMGKPEIE